jgi:multiple sugar transport system permease protein
LKPEKSSKGVTSVASPLPYLGRAAWSLVRFLFLVCMTFVIFYPLAYMFSLSIRHSRDIYDMSVVWIPKHYTLENLKMVFENLEFGKVMLNSGILALFGTFLSVFVCSLAGYGFARFEFRGNRLLFFIVILSILIPPQLTALPNYVLFSSFDFFGIYRMFTGHETGINMLDNMGTVFLLAVLGQGIRSGLIIFIFRQYYRGIPLELEQAAVIDGCGYAGTYFRIMLPNAGGPIRISILFSIVWYWSDYYILTTYLPNTKIVSSVISSIPDALQHILYMEARDPYKVITIEQAACVASILPLLILYLIVQKTFARSIETTGLVG